VLRRGELWLANEGLGDSATSTVSGVLPVLVSVRSTPGGTTTASCASSSCTVLPERSVPVPSMTT
jgi:hypothetical protein